MVTAANIRTDVNSALNEFGAVQAWWTYTKSYSGTDYDEAYRTSGASFSGLAVVQPIGNSDTSYVEAGAIKFSDKIVYLTGSLSLTTDSIFNYGGDQYQVLPEGIKKWDVKGTTVLQKAYVRLRTGSVNIY